MGAGSALFMRSSVQYSVDASLAGLVIEVVSAGLVVSPAGSAEELQDVKRSPELTSNTRVFIFII